MELWDKFNYGCLIFILICMLVGRIYFEIRFASLQHGRQHLSNHRMNCFFAADVDAQMVLCLFVKTLSSFNNYFAFSPILRILLAQYNSFKSLRFLISFWRISLFISIINVMDFIFSLFLNIFNNFFVILLNFWTS